MAASSDPGDSTSQSTTSSWTSGTAVELIRIGVGIVWFINLIFIVTPQNHYWSTFSANALAFAPSTIGGPGLAEYVSANPLFFSWAIALCTGYLAIAFTFGLTTRAACFVGSIFSGLLFATQFGTTFFFPGGTDVGEHPLYLLIYAGLVVGGAGSAHSLDVWLPQALADWRAARRVAPVPVSRPWATSVPPRTLFVYFVAGTLISLGVGFGLVIAIPPQPNGPGSALPPTPVSYVNLTIDVNNTTGYPYYTPANFSVPAGVAIFTIMDYDDPINWSGCPCPVTGTVGDIEVINGTPMSVVPATNVAHTFNIPELGLQVLSPGGGVAVQFKVDLTHAGAFSWYCLAPCGTGANPYNSPPMGVPGLMTGTMTVT